MVGVTLVHRKGYFRQRLDARGNQTEEPAPWSPETHLEPVPEQVTVAIERRPVRVRAWRYSVRGLSGQAVPVYLLDTDLEENTAWDRTLTDSLYGGDRRLPALSGSHPGRRRCRTASDPRAGRRRHLSHERRPLGVVGPGSPGRISGVPIRVTPQVRDAVRRQCVFTTHTPVPAGQDQFPADLARQVLGAETADALAAAGCCLNGSLNMTHMALTFSHYVNGVALRHEEISRTMFPGYPINSITNGVHAVTWAADPYRDLFDRHVPEWRQDNLYLRYAVSIPVPEIIAAHDVCKRQLLAEVERRTRRRLADALTLGFAHRATAYKRADLLFRTWIGNGGSPRPSGRSRSSSPARPTQRTRAGRPKSARCSRRRRRWGRPSRSYTWRNTTWLWVGSCAPEPTSG